MAKQLENTRSLSINHWSSNVNFTQVSMINLFSTNVNGLRPRTPIAIWIHIFLSHGIWNGKATVIVSVKSTITITIPPGQAIILLSIISRQRSVMQIPFDVTVFLRNWFICSESINSTQICRAHHYYSTCRRKSSFGFYLSETLTTTFVFPVALRLMNRDIVTLATE